MTKVDGDGGGGGGGGGLQNRIYHDVQGRMISVVNFFIF